MSGATRTIQQPAGIGSLSTTVGLIALIAATALAIAVGAAGRTTTQVSAPAPIYAPAVRDLGARDLGSTNATAGEVMPKAEAGSAPATVGKTNQPVGYHGFGGPAPASNSSGSNQAAPAVHRPGLRPS